MATLSKKHSENKTPERRERARQPAVALEISSKDATPINRLELLKLRKVAGLFGKANAKVLESEAYGD